MFSTLRLIFKDAEFNNLTSERDSFKYNFEEVTRQYKDLINQRQELNELDSKAFEINHKHTPKNIFYLGRSFKTKLKDSMIECDVKNFVTPNDDLIRNLIKDNNLNVVNPLKCDEDIVKIYKFCRNNSFYVYDMSNFGKDETWLFPFEFMYLNKKGDCEDNSHLITSVLIGAGVPSFRVRVVCGMCNMGGHSTVYVLSDDFKTWYHLNSTGGYEDAVKLSDYPTSKATNDGMGITTVWFSFNNEFAWSDFESPVSTSSFNKVAKKLFRIDNIISK